MHTHKGGISLKTKPNVFNGKANAIAQNAKLSVTTFCLNCYKQLLTRLDGFFYFLFSSRCLEKSHSDSAVMTAISRLHKLETDGNVTRFFIVLTLKKINRQQEEWMEIHLHVVRDFCGFGLYSMEQIVTADTTRLLSAFKAIKPKNQHNSHAIYSTIFATQAQQTVWFVAAVVYIMAPPPPLPSSARIPLFIQFLCDEFILTKLLNVITWDIVTRTNERQNAHTRMMSEF